MSFRITIPITLVLLVVIFGIPLMAKIEPKTLAYPATGGTGRLMLPDQKLELTSYFPLLYNNYSLVPTGKIVLASYLDGLYDIYSMNIDGSNHTRLTTDPGEDLSPDWSPDGSKIGFKSDRTGSYEIYLMNADGSDQTQLTTLGGCDSPQWSPDGRRIAFSSWQHNSYNIIYTMNPNGTDLVEVTDPAMSGTFPHWTPDGQKLAFLSRIPPAGIYVIDADGSNQTLLLAGVDILDFAWSPIGNTLALAKSVPPTNNKDLFLYQIDTGSTVRLTVSDRNHNSVDWSPDGDRLIFHSNLEDIKNFDVYILNVDGTNLINITNSPAGDNRADWIK